MIKHLPKTPAGDSLEKIKRSVGLMQRNPRMRRAIAAAIKAMGLPEPVSGSSSDPKAAR